MSCDFKCSVALTHSAVGWSAVCDCGIYWSYSHTLKAKYRIRFVKSLKAQEWVQYKEYDGL